jgi:hypothetical protein
MGEYAMFALPVSKLDVNLRLPTGREEMLLIESYEAETQTAVDLLEAVVDFAGECSDIADLPVPDVEYLLLELRRRVLGDVVRTHVRCSTRECRSPIDVDFRISDYLAAYGPKTPSSVVSDEEQGWFRLQGQSTRFRVPSATDQLIALGSADPERTLRSRCIEDPNVEQGAARRIERFLASMAPTLSGVLQGTCTECGSKVAFFFDVPRFVLTELRNQAIYVYQDVDRLASRYHWSEESILALPARRRVQYADLAESAGRQK